MRGSPQPVAAFSWPLSMPLSNGLSVILSFQHAASPLTVISSAVWTARSNRRCDATCLWWAWAYLRPLGLKTGCYRISRLQTHSMPTDVRCLEQMRYTLYGNSKRKPMYIRNFYYSWLKCLREMLIAMLGS
jgi:hypothetical protein